ncbi:MAG: hypothetical protein ACRD3W_16840 [Terriglobales bacterium]
MSKFVLMSLTVAMVGSCLQTPVQSCDGSKDKDKTSQAGEGTTGKRKVVNRDFTPPSTDNGSTAKPADEAEAAGADSQK